MLEIEHRSTYNHVKQSRHMPGEPERPLPNKGLLRMILLCYNDFIQDRKRNLLMGGQLWGKIPVLSISI